MTIFALHNFDYFVQNYNNRDIGKLNLTNLSMDSMFLSYDQNKEVISMEEAKQTKASSDEEASSSEIVSKWTDRNLFDTLGTDNDLFIESGRTCQ